ncbi:MAG: hypothetical protein NT093_00145 [Candidatus Moranbacteria bacterium]|nr:hypothetical protein [Candidatus Moranbacteria bacterium]
MEQASDKIIRFYTRLQSLKNNLSKQTSIKDIFVDDYHGIIDELSKTLTINLDEFKIPLGEVRPYPTSYSGDGTTTYTDEAFCSDSLFFSKLDALLSYFQIKYLSKEQPKIGFTYKEE